MIAQKGVKVLTVPGKDEYTQAYVNCLILISGITRISELNYGVGRSS